MVDFDSRGFVDIRGRSGGQIGVDHRGAINNGTSSVVQVPVTVSSPGLGLPVTEKRACLAAALPNGTDRYVGLFTGLPDATGVGGVEASGSNYARTIINSWSFEVLQQVVRRVNSSPVVFPTLDGDLTVVGWGVWDDATGGDLRAFGRVRTVGGSPITFELASGDTPRFLVGELQVGIQ